MQYQLDVERMASNASEAAAFLRSLANEHRLLILCRLMDGELSVGALNDQLGLTPSNLSQHLSKLRGEGLVAARREGTVLYYRIVSPEVRSILGALYEAFCQPATSDRARA